LANPNAAKDIEKAKQLLAQAGYPEGKGLPEFTYENMADTTSRQFGEMFERDMAKIGIKVKINGNTWPEFSSKMRTKRAQIFGYGSTYSYPDPEDLMSVFTVPTRPRAPMPPTSRTPGWTSCTRRCTT
ncbi:MAG: hypothetical protein HY303_21135, partial [Candidatus Wallbacteria bacterium]|nr:hypothetical protein [Candidatus Wallbacteria bacterium]